jgi:hypothetical protein
MPLNPPAYNGQDVYYSTNVFVNKVPVALWQPPAGAFNDGSPGTASVGGETMYASNASGLKAQQRDERQSMGYKTGEDMTDDSPDDSADPTTAGVQKGPFNNVIDSPGASAPLPTGPGAKPDPNPSAAAQPGDVELKIEDLPNTFPKDIRDPIYSKRISQYFKLGAMRATPMDEPQVQTTARGVAVNWINLCTNILDPIKSKYPNMVLNSAYRSTDYCKGSSPPMKPAGEHTRGAAADIDLGSEAANNDLFKWILQNLPYYQLLREANPGRPVGWVHVSYLKGGAKKGAAATGWTKTGGTNLQFCGETGQNLPAYIKP